MLRKLWQALLGAVWMLATAGGGFAAIMMLDPTDYPIVQAAVSSKMITFAVAMFGVVLVEVLYAWRFDINLRETFNRIEQHPMAAALILSALILGPCLVAGSVFK